MNKNLSQKCIPGTLVSRNNARSIQAILILTSPQDSAPERHSHPSGENFLNLIDKVHQIHCSLHWAPLLLLPPLSLTCAPQTQPSGVHSCLTSHCRLEWGVTHNSAGLASRCHWQVQPLYFSVILLCSGLKFSFVYPLLSACFILFLNSFY